MGKLGKRKRAKDVAELEASTSSFLGADDGRVGVGVGIIDYASAERAADSLSRRLDVWSSAPLKAVRAALFPLLSLEIARGTHFEPRADWTGFPPPDTSPAALAPLIAAAAYFLRDDETGEAFRSPLARALRRALHPLVVEARGGGGDRASLVARISRSLRAREWTVSLALLREYAGKRGPPPRLGALQRWVRDADNAKDIGGSGVGLADADDDDDDNDDNDDNVGERDAESRRLEASAARTVINTSSTSGAGTDLTATTSAAALARNNLSLLLLDAVMRAAIGVEGEGATTTMTKLAKAKASPPTTATLIHHPPFSTALSPLPPPPPTATSEWSLRVRNGSRIVSRVAGATRRPPTPHDLLVWATVPRSVNFLDDDNDDGDDTNTATTTTTLALSVTKIPIPSVSGAFLCANVLSQSECHRFIAAAEAIGFTPDAVPGIEALQWLADTSLVSKIFSRISPFLPQTLGEDTLIGINARWRLFRYSPGAEYRAHIDGAWPGAGLDPVTGLLRDDAFDGQRVSRLTLLFYLNQGFEGGSTTFLRPHPTEIGTIDAFPIRPIMGGVLLFPHGDAASLVHEGSAVIGEGGVKYVIRSDILFQRGGTK